jgi:signal peptidase I
VNVRKLIRSLLWVLAIFAVIAGVLYIMFDPWRVPGDDAQFSASIEPTMSAGDIVLVSRIAGATDGNLVRCSDPDSPGRYVVGRVAGSGQDTVEFTNGLMSINGKTPSASVACDPATVQLRNPATQEDEELNCFMEELAGGTHPALRPPSGKTADRDSKSAVETGKVFLASDNRVLHLDSRDFGQVSPASCHAIVLRLWGGGGWGDSKHRLTMLW